MTETKKDKRIKGGQQSGIWLALQVCCGCLDVLSSLASRRQGAGQSRGEKKNKNKMISQERMGKGLDARDAVSQNSL